ncbi:alpha/beta hydrolase, partial [Streptomyces albidoflavus]
MSEAAARGACRTSPSAIHVEVHGAEGAPAIVLSHGWTC